MFTLLFAFTAYLYHNNTILLTALISGILIDTLFHLFFKKRFYDIKEENKNLRNQIIQLDNAINTQQRTLSYQIRMQVMGSMLGHLAHQWRQPLCAITTLSSSLSLYQEQGTLKESELNTTLKSIGTHACELSQTIDNFRILFHPKKEKEVFLLNEAFYCVYDLLKLDFQSHTIVLDVELEKIHVVGHKDIYMQIFMHLLQYLCTKLVLSKKKRKLICVKMYTKEHQNYLHFVSNQGEVSCDILHDLFTNTIYNQPLYITKTLINKELKGDIRANMLSFEHKHTSQKGIEFQISVTI